jgi:drug/metabolite transporter (DMT)-like permease
MRDSLPNQSNLTRGYSVAVAAAAILSTTAIFIRYLTQTYHIPALVLAFWRDAFVALTLLVLLRILSPRLLHVERKTLPFLIIYGLVLALFNSLWTVSVALNGAAISTVLVYCSTAFTVLLGRWLLKESLDWSKITAVVLSLAGCALVSGALDKAVWNTNLLAIFTGVISGLGYAIYTLMGRSASQRSLNPWTITFYAFVFATFFLLAFNLLSGGVIPGTAATPAGLFWLGDSLPGWGILFLLAAGPTVAGFGLYNVSLSYLPSGITNLVLTLEPVFTTLIAYVVLSERLNGSQISGGLMILSGVIFLRVYEGWLAVNQRGVAGAT